MVTANIYLHFNGNCREAFDFYKSIFGGDYPYVGTFGDMPSSAGFEIPEEQKNHIMHISLPLSEHSTLLGSDVGGEWSDKFKQGNNYSVSLNVDSKEEADRIFNALSENGNVLMPIADTFWQSYFGTVVDQFGISWMVSFDLSTHKSKQ